MKEGQAQTWWEQLYSMKDDHRRALDHLYSGIDIFYKTREYRGLGIFLSVADFSFLSTHLLVGLLSILQHHKTEIEAYPHIYQRVKDRLQVLAPDRIDRLLGSF